MMRMGGDGPPVSELQAQKAVMQLFTMYRWGTLKFEEDRFRGVPGVPDLLNTAPCGGLQLWVEMKRPPSKINPRGRVRKAQKERLIAWRLAGVLCCVADGLSPTLQRIASWPSISHDDGVDWPLIWCDELMRGYEWWPV